MFFQSSSKNSRMLFALFLLGTLFAADVAASSASGASTVKSPQTAAAAKSQSRPKPKLPPKTLDQIEASLIDISADVLEALEHEKKLGRRFRLLLISEELRDANNFTDPKKVSTFYWFFMLFCDTSAEFLVSAIGSVMAILYSIKFLALTKLGRIVSTSCTVVMLIGFALRYALHLEFFSYTVDSIYFSILSTFVDNFIDFARHFIYFDTVKAFTELLGTITIVRNFIPLFIAILHPPSVTRPVELDKTLKKSDGTTAGGKGGLNTAASKKEVSTSSDTKSLDTSNAIKKEKVGGGGGLLKTYSSLLKQHPFLVGVPQHALILSLANITKQFIIFSTSYETAASAATPVFHVDWFSVKNAAILGGVAMAPLHYVWFKILNKYVQSPLYKTLIDQFIASWFFNMYVLFVLSKLNGESFNITWDTLHVVYISWLWWIPVRGIMFYMIPDHLMLPWQTLGSFGWNVIMFMFVGR